MELTPAEILQETIAQFLMALQAQGVTYAGITVHGTSNHFIEGLEVKPLSTSATYDSFAQQICQPGAIKNVINIFQIVHK